MVINFNSYEEMLMDGFGGILLVIILAVIVIGINDRVY